MIRARLFGEADKIVTFLTRDLGKVAGIAKGAKHSKRRFVNVLEPFTHVQLRLRQRSSSDLAFIDACEILDVHLSFARDLTKFGYASYVLELTDRMVREREAGHETYDLVRDVLAVLERNAPESGLLRAFELQLLRLTGYEPALDRCRRCSRAAAELASLYVHPGRGGVLCPGCRGEGRAYVTSPATLARLGALASTPIGEGGVERFALPPGMAAESRILVRSFFAQNLSAPLASERFLDDVQIDPP